MFLEIWVWLPPKRAEELPAYPTLPWVHILLFFVETLILVWSSSDPDERTNLAVKQE